MKSFAKILQILFLLSVAIQPANSQVLDSTFHRWKVYEMQENELDYKKCYIVSRPIKSDSDHNFRQKPYLMITRFQKDRTEEVSIYSGFEFKLSSKIMLLAGYDQFSLATKGDIAWAKTKYEDARIIETLLNQGFLKVRSDSAVGTYAVDEYSMKGIVKAYTRMKEICK